MKKKIMSPEALAALAAGKLVDHSADATGEAGTGADASAGDTTVENQSATDGTAGEAEGAETEDDTQAVELQGQIDALTADVSAKDAQIVELTAKVTDLEAQALSADVKVKASAEESQEFKAIVIGQISVMRTALSLAAVDMTNWTAEAILREYTSTSESFEKALPVGSQVPETKETKPAASAMTNLDAAKINALGFK